eukprot:TRINITY_DN22798_c0_g1_i3.p1 TRINITY_DN22798_c0_g1~~TRINITY_DN22798_c0_g1_i3.p1  ORF type:complete len:218 (-),score=41.59 TRINITY_DN22798_c0_g1_i3:59-712(-)
MCIRDSINAEYMGCEGQAQGYSVHLSTNSINYGEIKIGNSTSRLLLIHNDSDLPVTFEFFNDQSNVFGLSKCRGKINPKQYERIIVNFVPKHTICYYERMFCIVRNHTLLYLDLIGTCYDLLIKPIPLLQKHIDAFRRRVVEGKLSEVDFKYMENALLMKVSQTFNQSTRQLESNKEDQLEKTNTVSYTHLRAHETRHDLVCRLLLEKKKKKSQTGG